MLRAPATSSQALPAASAGTPTPCCAGMNSTLNVSAPAQPLPPSTCGATTDSKLATAGLHDALGRRTDLLRRARYASRSQTQAPAPALTVCVSVSGCTSSVVCREGRQWAGDVSQPRGRVLLLAREGYIRVPLGYIRLNTSCLLPRRCSAVSPRRRRLRAGAIAAVGAAAAPRAAAAAAPRAAAAAAQRLQQRGDAAGRRRPAGGRAGC